MNNPFAPVAHAATPPAPPPVASSNPFAAVAPAGAVGGAGVQAIQQAFAAQTAPAAAAPVNPFACDGVGRRCPYLGPCQMRAPVGAPTLIQLRQWADQPEDQ